MGGNAHRACVQIADPHHHTAKRHQGSRSKTEFLCAQKGCYGHVTAAHELTVCFNDHPITESVAQECLVCFRKPQLPGQSSIVDGTYRRGPGAAVIAGNQDNLGPRFRDPCRHRANACLRNQLYRYTGIFIGVFQIINQLRQILNGIDIVMRRRRNQAYARRGMTGSGNPRVYLFGGKMAAFTRFCPLRHLNLNFPGAHQIPAGYAKAPAGNLFDGRASVVIGSGRFQTFLTLSALPAVRLAVEPVHGNRQRLMGFLRNGTVRHGACLETLYNGFHTFHLFYGYPRLRIPKIHEAA